MAYEAREALKGSQFLCRGRLPITRPKISTVTHSVRKLPDVAPGSVYKTGEEICARISWAAAVFVENSTIYLYADGYEGRLGSNMVARLRGEPETPIDICFGKNACSTQGPKPSEWVVGVVGLEPSRAWMRAFCEVLCRESYVEFEGFGDGTGENELLIHGVPADVRRACSLAVDGGIAPYCYD